MVLCLVPRVVLRVVTSDALRVALPHPGPFPHDRMHVEAKSE